MGDITRLISRDKKSREENQMKQFERVLSLANTKQEQRKVEMHLLKPIPVSEYKGSKVGRTDFQKRTLLLAFPDSSFIKRIGKFFRINAYIENNTYDVEFLMELIGLMEKGRIRWSGKKKRFFIKNKKGREIRI